MHDMFEQFAQEINILQIGVYLNSASANQAIHLLPNLSVKLSILR